MNRVNGHNSQDATVFPGGEPTAFRKSDDVETLVERMLHQCRALLHQQLEHKTRREPLLYNAAAIEQVMRQFDAASEDIQSVILDRVRARVRTFVQHELERVLQDSTDAAVTALEEPVVGPIGYERPIPAEGVPSWPETPRDNRPMDYLGQGSRNGVVDLPVNPTASRPEKLPPAATPPARRDDYRVGEPAPRREAAPATPPPGTMKRQEETPLPAADYYDGPPAVAVPTQPSGDEVLHGRVKLSIAANDSIQQVIHFIDALRRRNEFRVVQVVGSHNQGVGVWLVLRIPMPLKQVLLGMGGVTQVAGPEQSTSEEDDAPVVTLRLAPVSLN